MTGPKRSKAQRERDFLDISRMYLRGNSLMEIAAAISSSREYSLSHMTIHKDLKVIVGRWQESSIVDMDAAKAKELAKVDNLEAEYWGAWKRSTEQRKSTVTKRRTAPDGQSNEAQVRVEDFVGDPRYLEGVAKCIELRCKLLGLNAPTRNELTGANGKPLVIVSEAQENEALERYARAAATVGSRN